MGGSHAPEMRDSQAPRRPKRSTRDADVVLKDRPIASAFGSRNMLLCRDSPDLWVRVYVARHSGPACIGARRKTGEILNSAGVCHGDPLRSEPGGRCRDRTCDPTRVKGVLYR